LTDKPDGLLKGLEQLGPDRPKLCSRVCSTLWFEGWWSPRYVIMITWCYCLVLYVCYVYAVTSGGEEEESAAEDSSRKDRTFDWNVCSSVEVFPECLVGSHGSGVPHTLPEEQESLKDSLRILTLITPLLKWWICQRLNLHAHQYYGGMLRYAIF
jgi:hypothetical protein